MEFGLPPKCNQLLQCCLTPKCPRPFFYQNPLKTASSAAFIQKKRKKNLESNRKILYFTCLKSCGKNFMKFDRTDWKIIAFKIGKIYFFKCWPAISDHFDSHLWNFFALDTLNLKFFVLKN